MPNAAQISLARTLLSKTGNSSHKDDIIRGFTGQRTQSISAMTDAEFSALIAHLRTLDPNAAAADKMRKKIISLAHEMGWHKKDGTGKLLLNKNRKPIADMPRIDGWCKTYGHLKKSLDNYTYKELPTLVTQFTNVYDQYLKKF